MTSDKYVQDKKLALAKWFADGCPFEEDEDVLEFKKSQEAREARERGVSENGAGVTHSKSTGTGRRNSVSGTGRADGNTFYTPDWTTHLSRKAGSLNTSANRTKATNFREVNKYRCKDLKPGKLSGSIEILKRNDRRSEPIKPIERAHWQKQECHHEI